MTRTILIATLATTLLATAVAAQKGPANATVVYVVGAEPTMPIPVFSNSAEADEDLSDQLFLHLLVFAPNSRGTTDNSFAPALARAWHRVDPVTLTFDLDPRAHWHDGVPVTAHDVVYTWSLINHPKVVTDRSRFDQVAAVDAVDDHTVRVRFKQPSGEQVYTFGFLMQPLPAHLLEKIAPEAIPASDFVRHPVGNGPFRYERRTAGLAVELRADSAFFLGRPGINRVLFRTAVDPTARVNLFLTGESDILDKIPLASLPQVQQHAGGRLTEVPSDILTFLWINGHNGLDTLKPHPILGDVRVREALQLALDRETIAHTVYGPSSQVPDAAQSQIWGWITGGTISGTPPNPGRARTLLAQAGWRAGGSDGILVRNGAPLHLTLLYAASSSNGNLVALRAQQMWRAVGADVQLERVEGAVIGNRVKTGQWDMVYKQVGQDPTPSSLVQSWSCESARQASSSNLGRWCDTTFDRLVHTANTAKNQAAAWRDALNRMAGQHPAIFLAAAGNPVAISARYDNAITWPSHTWISLWQWRVRPAAALPRDR